MKCVYFIRRADGVGPVKIGCSKYPRERLGIMQIWSPYKLEVLTACGGEFRDERTIHRAFDAYRMEGEWFDAAPCVLDLIERVKASGEIPAEFRAPPLTPKAKQANPHWDEIVSRARAGETYGAIGRTYGLARQRVHQIAVRAGCAGRKSSRAFPHSVAHCPNRAPPA